jgi:hypothetical protein
MNTKINYLHLLIIEQDKRFIIDTELDIYAFSSILP